MTDETQPEKLTLGDALKDLGWIPILFAVFVGGPSLLAIIESVVVDHQLVPALQWLVDGYQRVMTLVGAIVDPLVQPIIDWLNQRFGWHLTLDPVWRPVFALSMITFIALLRTGEFGATIQEVLISLSFPAGLFAAALCVGLLMRENSWVAQGAIAALPPSFIFSVVILVGGSGKSFQAKLSALLFFFLLLLFLFAIGAGLSFVRPFQHASGLVTLGSFIAASGILFLRWGLRDNDRDLSRYGLTTLGGFFSAGLILAADWAIEAFAVA